MSARRPFRARLGMLLVFSLFASTVAGLPPKPVEAAPLPPQTSVPVSEIRPRVEPGKPMQAHSARPVSWPQQASAVVSVSRDGLAAAVSASVGGLPITVSAIAKGDSFSGRSLTTEPAPSSVKVEVLDRALAQRAGSAMALRVTRADGGTGAAKIRLSADFSSFREAFGGAYAARMTLRLVPECGLAAVSAAEAERGACAGVELASDLDFRRGVIAADIDLAAQLPGLSAPSAKQRALYGIEAGELAVGKGLVVLFTSGNQADGVGTFGKASLKESSTWSHSGASGNFSYSYPLSAPAVPGDLAPALSLSYSSATVDGQTAAEHIQNGPLGEGWSLGGTGFIESTFRPCSLDTDHSPTWTNATGDPCWRHQNYQISWPGASGELVPTSTPNVWKIGSDEGVRVEYLAKPWGVHWVVTTVDGTQYFFGRQLLPGWTAGGRETGSILWHEAFANHSDEPCFSAAGYTSSHCWMPYKWMLDYVVDRDGNSMSYWYTRHSNLAGSNNSGSTVFSYHRDVTLDRIEYGTRAGNESTATPPAVIDFTNSDRCVSSCGTEAAPVTANWHDTPFDKRCAAAPCNSNISPSYWTTKRLTQITTKVWTGSGTTYKPVDEWRFGQSFPGGTDVPTLWLDSITHRGYDSTGAWIDMPALTTHGRKDGNRADYNPGASMADPQKYRIDYIETETGKKIEVSYLSIQPECTWWSGKLEAQWPNYNDNAYHCFQQWVTNRSGASAWSWWHKFVVDRVTEKDLVGGSPDVITSYTYAMDGTTSNRALALWGYTTSVWASPKKAMSSWKGYPTVTTTVGAVGQSQSKTRRLYYRGLDRDTGLNTGQNFFRTSAVVDSLGASVVDHQALGGQVREEVVFDGANEISKSVSTQTVWQSAGGALPTWQTPPERISYLARTTSAKTLTKVSGGTWRTNETNSTFDTTFGTVSTVDDLGQTSPALTTDDVCVRHTYNRATGRTALWHKGTGTSPAVDQAAGLAANLDMAGYREVFSPGDFTGDGKPDLFAISESDNGGYIWAGNGTGGFTAPRIQIAPNWSTFVKVWSTGDVTGDGRVDLLLLDIYGVVYLAVNVNGNSHVGGGQMVTGWGWVDRAFSPGDVTGDGIGDVYLRNGNNGELWMSPGTGGGHFGAGVLLGGGWGMWEHFAGRGDVTGDGKTDIYTYDPIDASVWVHNGNGVGGFTGTKTKIATGWLNRHSLITPGDANADGKPDLWSTESAWITSTVSRSETVGVNCAATVVYPAALIADSRAYFDGNTSLTYRPLRAKTTKTELASSHNGTTATYLTTGQAGYDKWGRPVWTKDALGNQTDTSYTHDAAGRVASTAVSTPVPATGAPRHTITTTFDQVRGVALAVTDPNSKITTGTYDALGRILTVRRPGNSGTHPDVAYVYSVTKTAPSWIHTKALGPNGNQISTYEIYDGLLRLRQTQATAPDGKRSISDTQFDGRGNAAKLSIFHNGVSAPTSTLHSFADTAIYQQTRYVYDGAGRRTFLQLWKQDVKQFETQSVYEGDRVGVIPPAGGTVTQDLSDARGRVVESRTYQSAVALSGLFDRTLYGYDRSGKLTTITDPANNVWTYKYDLLGRKYETIDPDTGTSKIVYNDAGWVTSTEDGRGQKLFFEYDNLGRKTRQRADSAGGTEMATWTYDTLAKGHLTSTSRKNGATTLHTYAVGAYDNGYRPLSTTESVPGFGAGGGVLDYQVSNTYHVNGSAATVVLPAIGGVSGETLTYTYTDQGMPDTVATVYGGVATTYVADTIHAFDGAVVEQRLGVAGKQVKLIDTFDEATRRLATAAVATEASGAFTEKFSTGYGYDAIGNIKSAAGKTNGTTDQVECFTYDYLRLLREAWTQAAAGCVTPQRAGADPYRRQWTFDTIGNRSTQTDKNTTDTVWTSTLGAAGSVKPHQVKQITSVGPLASQTRTFSYDNAGNMLTGTSPTGVAQEFGWDKEGHLATVKQNTVTTATYTYDTGGRRVVAVEPVASVSTAYLADGTELEKVGSANPLATRHYPGAVRDAAGLRWVAVNHQGSSTIQIDAVTMAATRRRFMPYGEGRGTQPPTWLGNKGYVNGTVDTTGLVHLGARDYDPTLGRFISVDPIMDMTDPQQWNGYTYANGSPVTHSDPTGLKVFEDAYGGGQEFTSVKAGAKVHRHKKAIEALEKKYGGDLVVQPSETFEQFLEAKYNTHVSNVREGDYIESAAQYTCFFLGDCTLNQIFEAERFKSAVSFHEIMSWVPILGIPSSIFLINEAIKNKEYGSAGLEAAGLIPFAKVLKVGKYGDEVTDLTGDVCKHSFDPGTAVLLADGTIKAIKDVAVGDLVLATDPVTGQTAPKPVIAIHENVDTDLTLVVVRDESGATALIDTTWEHPFWLDSAQSWVDAAELVPGDRLMPASGSALTVVTVESRRGSKTMHDLTVADIHTYYVLAGGVAALVHNCGEARFAVDGAGVTDDLVTNPKIADQFPKHLIPNGGKASDVAGHVWGAGPKQAADKALQMRSMSPEDLRGLLSRNDAYDLHAFYTLAKRDNPGNVSAAIRVQMLRRILDAWGG